MDLEILKKVPSLDTEVLLIIRPLAPLSMVSDMPGSFYKTLKTPSKKMLCGLFENILDWQFSLSDRKIIWNDYKKQRKKHKLESHLYSQGSTYLPLLMDYFNVEGEIEIKELKSIFFYKDLWNKGYRRTDVYKHINGCRNADINIIAEYYDAFKSIDMMKITSNDKNKLKNDWFKDHIGSFPYYYTSPTSREFISLDGTYQIHLHMDRMLYEQLNNSQYNNNVGYLGTNEGWVDVNLRKI